MEIFDHWPVAVWLVVLAATVFAGMAHGAIGFGFPLLSTPLLALITDVRAAVLVTLLPNIVINVISIVRGPDWLDTLRKHWPVAAWVLLGAVLGSRALALADPRLLKVLLATLIVVYLLQSRRSASVGGGLLRYPRAGALIFGLLGGFFSGTVNVALPPLLIYFTALELTGPVLTQAMNLCFLAGRATQAGSLVAAGQIGPGWLLLGLPLSGLAVVALVGGFALQRRIRPQTFLRLVRVLLWAMAVVLVGQAARDTWSLR